MVAANPKTLRSIDELCGHALLPRERLGELAEVAARYAVAITPAMADLIDHTDAPRSSGSPTSFTSLPCHA